MRTRSVFLEVFWDLIKEDLNILLIIGTAIGTAILLGISIVNTIKLELIVSIGVYIAILPFYFVNLYRKAKRLVSEKHIPIVITTVSAKETKKIHERAKKIIEEEKKFKSFKDVEDYYNIRLDSLVISYEKSLASNDRKLFFKILRRVFYEVNDIDEKVEGDNVFHLFIWGYSSIYIALALGILLGRRKIIAYKPSGPSDWKPIDLTNNIGEVRRTDINNYEHIDISSNSIDNDDIAVILELGSKPIESECKKYIENKLSKSINKPIDIVTIRFKGGKGELDEEKHLKLLKEVYHAINNIIKCDKRIHLFYSMPVSLAYWLGAALMIYPKMTVYMYDTDNNTHFPLFKMKDIKDIES